MRRVLVTRPSPAGEELVGRLRTLGVEAWSLPLIEFTPGRELPYLPEYLTHLAPGDLLVALSKQAVNFAAAALKQAEMRWPEQVSAFAIGRATALALHANSGLQVNYPRDREISEVLLQLPELQNINGKTALILRGNGGRELLGTVLGERGASVRFCECYQRNFIHYTGEEEAARWYERGISTLVVTSGEMLQQLWSLFPDWHKHHWLLRCQLIVVSERLAFQAVDLGWKKIKVADNADNDARLRAITT